MDNCIHNEADVKELIGQLIDIVEDYVNPDSTLALIVEKDYDNLADKFTETLKNWNLIP